MIDISKMGKLTVGKHGMIDSWQNEMIDRLKKWND